MVRLKSAYIIRCDDFKKDESGMVTEIYASYIPESRSGSDSSGIHAKGTIHWVSTKHAMTVEVRLYDRLFSVENPDGEEGNFKDYLNPESLTIIERAYAEQELKNAKQGEYFQFIRKGYFCIDSKHSDSAHSVFNRTTTLKDHWAKSSIVKN